MIELKMYRVLVNHDKGLMPIWITASSEEAAKRMVMEAEGCPERAIRSIERMSSAPTRRRK